MCWAFNSAQRSRAASRKGDRERRRKVRKTGGVAVGEGKERKNRLGLVGPKFFLLIFWWNLDFPPPPPRTH